MSLRLSRWLHHRGFSRKRLKGSFFHRYLGDGVLAKDLWSLKAEPVARAWLIGVPITIIPFLPFQSFIAIPLAIIFRANVPITFAIQWISNPFTAVVHLPACYYFGCLVLRKAPSQAFDDLVESLPRWSDFQLHFSVWLGDVLSQPWGSTKRFFNEIFGEKNPGVASMSVGEIIFPLYFGAFILGILLAVVGYFLIKAYGPQKENRLEKPSDRPPTPEDILD